MSEEEKKAIEDSKELINELNDYEGFAGRLYYKNKPIEKILETLLNLIEKLREKLKLVDDYNYWVQLASDRGLELEKLQKENEELKNKIMEKELERIGKEEYTKASMGEIIEQYYTANEECIPVQKVKDKIEELSKTKSDLATYIAVSERIRALQELLEESEE